jgi:hypothetical protein
MRRAVLALAVLAFAEPALAGCCNVVRTSTPASPESPVRVCDMVPTGGCKTVLYEGPLDTGSSVNVCAESGFIVSMESDGAGGWGEHAGAVCDGSDVEI